MCATCAMLRAEMTARRLRRFVSHLAEALACAGDWVTAWVLVAASRQRPAGLVRPATIRSPRCPLDDSVSPAEITVIDGFPAARSAPYLQVPRGWE